MIFDTLAAMADWSDDKKFDKSATQSGVQAVMTDLGRSYTPKQIINEITQGGTLTFANDTERAMRIFAWGVQNGVPRSVLELMMTSSSSSSSSNSSSSSQNLPPAGIKITVTGASGTIDWSGYTWNLPADSGVSHDITEPPVGGALTLYRGKNANSFSDYGSSRIVVRTASRTILHANIVLRRSFVKFSFGKYYANRIKFDSILGPGLDVGERRDWNSYPPFTTSTAATGSSDLDMILTVPKPTEDDYLMDDRWYGSYTNGGVTYTWEKIV